VILGGDMGPPFWTLIWGVIRDLLLGPRFGTLIWGVIWDLHLGPDRKVDIKDNQLGIKLYWFV
jgi:hypothetical protein